MPLLTLSEERCSPYCLLDRAEQWSQSAGEVDKEHLQSILDELDVEGVPAATPLRLQALINLSYVALDLLRLREVSQACLNTVTAN